ncbi:MHYT domain-containing protein [Brevundimonas naejangsanensis]|uniref:MHYT domain-containing protein n=1 Tax=Brevundimonas naejangsanensis TaxID=588932 RepID=UPI001F09DE18|nr:MHYT domain-containing protein [Brevundimonas naejangsanensis]
MNAILSCLIDQHDWRIAPFAVLVCAFSLAIALVLFDRAKHLSSRARRPYLISAPLVGGLGVWTTHFIAMLAYDAGVAVRYDPLRTALSLAVVTAAFWTAMHLRLAGADAGWRRRSVLAATVIITAGVAAMHFIGMEAMRLSGAVLTWHAPRAILAVAGGLALFGAAALLPQIGRWKRLAMGTTLTVSGVCWLHFTAMSAATLSPAPGVLLPSEAASPVILTLWTGLGVGLTVVVAAFFTGMIWWSRRSALGQLLEAIHAMPDGVGVYDADDRLVLWNRRYEEINPHLADVLKPGVTFRQVVAVGLNAGVYPDAAGREETWIIERMASRRAPAAPREMQVGDRWLRVQDRPTTGGGWSPSARTSPT